MRARTVLMLAVWVALLVPQQAEGAGCGFQLGFRAIAEQIPDVVGQCLEDEHFNTSNGNAEQRTTAWHGKGGLLVWRKADNWTAFTDGNATWINGPYGLQRRLNTERFPWEADPVSVAATPACSVTRPFRASFDGVTIVDYTLFRTDWGTTAMRVRVRNDCDQTRLIGWSAVAFEGDVPVALGSAYKDVYQPREEKGFLYGWAIEGQPYPNIRTDSFVGFQANWTLPQSSDAHCVAIGFGKCIVSDPWLRSAIGWLVVPRGGGGDLLRVAAGAGVRLEYGDVPFGALGVYSKRTKVVTLWRELDAYSDFERATVLAHELRHAVDDVEGRLEADRDGCYRAEERAFREQSRVWRGL